ncbi:MAG: phage portal protein [Candidatus Omnitrophica bacterium]|nr:phage portal protein [Candidatus Omnitrophota bacterium]
MKIISGKFPNNIERERITTLRKYEKLNENESQSVLGLHEIIKKQYKNVADLVYLAHAVPYRISEFYGDFVQGDSDKMVIEAAGEKEEDNNFINEIVERNDIKEKIYDWADDQSEFGFFVLLGRVDDKDKYIIESVPQDQYFPQADGSVIFATYKRDPADHTGHRLLCFTQNYQIENETVLIEREAWTTNEQGIVSDKYDFEAMLEILGEKYKETEILELDDLPIRQIDNGKRSKYGFGKSDYANVMPQLAEINERSTHISTVLLKNLDAKMVMSKDNVDKEGKVIQREVFVVDGKEEVKPEFIVNNNSMIEETREHIISEMKFISWITAVPMFEILKSSMPDRVESLRIQLFQAVRKTDTKRSKLKKGLSDMLKIGFKMAKKNFEENIIISFSDVLPTDDLQLVQIEETKIRSGTSSRRSSMKRIENYNDDEADEETEQIKTEEAIAGIGTGGEAPTL